MVTACRLISKRVTKVLRFRKSVKSEVLRLLGSGPSVKKRFSFWGFSRINWNKIKDKNEHYKSLECHHTKHVHDYSFSPRKSTTHQSESEIELCLPIEAEALILQPKHFCS